MSIAPGPSPASESNLTPQLLAILSGAAYERANELTDTWTDTSLGSGDTILGWSEVSAADLLAAQNTADGTTLTEIPFSSNWGTSGFSAQAYTNPSSGSIIIAFRGTDDNADYVTDINLYLGSVDLQYLHAYFYVEAVKAYATANGLDLFMTGHSLGGALASIFAAREDSDAIVFNPALAEEGVKAAFNDVTLESTLIPGVTSHSLATGEAGIEAILIDGDYLTARLSTSEFFQLIADETGTVVSPIEQFFFVQQGQALYGDDFNYFGFNFGSSSEVLDLDRNGSYFELHSLELLTLLLVEDDSGDRLIAESLFRDLTWLAEALLNGPSITGLTYAGGDPDLGVTLIRELIRDDLFTPTAQTSALEHLSGTLQSIATAVTNGTISNDNARYLGEMAIQQAWDYATTSSNPPASSTNSAPTDINISVAAIDENTTGTTIGTLSATDADTGDIHLFEVDDSRVVLAGDVLSLRSGTSVDHETDPTITISVTVFDGEAASYSEDLVITINDVNEQPSLPSVDDQSVDEGSTVIGALSATDPEGDSLTYDIKSGSPNAALFDVSGTTLSLASAIDFEALPVGFADQGDGTASSNVTVEVTDGEFTREQTFTITVNDVNEQPSLPSLDDQSVDEGGTVIGTLSASDPEEDSLTFDIKSGSPNAALFSVSGTTLSLASAIDFEALPAGFADQGDGTATANVTVEVTDGELTREQTFAITVNDVNEQPSLPSLDDQSVDEGDTAIGTLSATDPEGDSLTFSIKSGSANEALFDVSGTTLSLSSPIDFEALPAGFADQNDGTATADATVEVTDGEHTTEETFTITVNDLDDVNLPPIDLALSRTVVNAGQSGAVVGALIVTDPDDTAHSFTFSDSRFEVVNGYLKLKPGEVVILNEVEINLDITATDSDAADYTEQVTITIVDPAAGLPIYATATSGDDVFTLGSSQYTTAQGGNGDDTYIVLPTLTNNASIFDLRGTNTIVFQEGVELVAGDEEPGVYHLHLGNGATIEINNAEGQLFQIGDGPALSFTDFKAAIAGSPTVETSAAAVHGTPIDQAAVFVPATGDSGDNTFSLGHNVFVNAAGSTGNDTYIITDNQTGDARIFDLRGDNTIVLADGLQITSGAMNASFQYELTLDNGAVIAIDNAEAYDFQVGTSGPTVDFSAISARVDEGPFVVSSTSSSSATAFMYRVPLVEEQLSFEGTTTTDMPVLELIHAAEPYKEIAKPAPDQSADIQGWQDGFFPEYSIDDLYLNFA